MSSARKRASLNKAHIEIDRLKQDLALLRLHYDALAALAQEIAGQHDAMKVERDQLRAVCAEAYQMAGALGAKDVALDNLLAAAQGEPLPHATFLPVAESAAVAQRDQMLAALKGCVEHMAYSTAYGGAAWDAANEAIAAAEQRR